MRYYLSGCSNLVSLDLKNFCQICALRPIHTCYYINNVYSTSTMYLLGGLGDFHTFYCEPIILNFLSFGYAILPEWWFKFNVFRFKKCFCYFCPLGPIHTCYYINNVYSILIFWEKRISIYYDVILFPKLDCIYLNRHLKTLVMNGPSISGA